MSERILVMIPCYNEAACIGGVLDEIARLEVPCDVLVVDDGSDDQTYALASARVRCVRLAVNLGIGGAVQTAVRFAEQHGYDLCIQLDGDGQHPPDQVPVLLEAYRREPASVVSGSRFLAEGGFRSSAARRTGIALIRTAFRLLYGAKVSDPTSGFRLFDRRAIRAFAEEYPIDFPEPISTAVALQGGLSVREVPVRMHARASGQSSIRGLTSLLYVLRVVGYLVLIRMGRHL